MTANDPLLFLKEQALSTQPFIPATNRGNGNEVLIVVLRQHRFYKQLCIELYKAPTTKSGKVKDPLTLINPLDLIWKTSAPDELKFYAGVARFQNNATTSRSAPDIDALHSVLLNPLQLHFFSHDVERSANVSSGSLVPAKPGSPITEILLFVDKHKDDYELSLQFKIDGHCYNHFEVEVSYDYLLLVGNSLHVINDFHVLPIVQVFRQHKTTIKVSAPKYAAFREQTLSKLEDRISVYYSFIDKGTDAQISEAGYPGAAQKFIYLSELDNYVLIDPVMRYGKADVPVFTKRNVYATDSNGNTFMLERDKLSEDLFIALLIRQHSDFEEQLDNDLPYFYLHKKQFLDEGWFLDVFEEWDRHNIRVLGFNRLKGNKLNQHKAKITIRVTSGTNWFNTNLSVVFGGKKAGLKQLQQSIRNKNKFVHLDDGTLGILPEEWIQRFTTYFNYADILEDELVTPKINYAAVADLYPAELLDAEVKREIEHYRSVVEKFDAIQPVDPPSELHATLREYQKHGLNWLNFLDDLNFGGCLADDMGLGKSVQIIAFILLQREKALHNTNLLVVPTSIMFNWEAEVQKFAPSITVKIISGPITEIGPDTYDGYELVVISYGTMVSNISRLKQYVFNYVFLDESQNIKNIDSQRYQAARLLQSKNRIAITGTPVENNVFDLYAQLSFACPGLLGNLAYFRDTYAIPIDKFKRSETARELQRIVAPFILRRTKKQVAPELPERTEMVLYCPMGSEQRKVYNNYEKEFRDFISSSTNDEITKSTMHVLKGLTRLRQVCNSPLLLEDEKLYGDASAKIDVLIQQVEDKAPEHKILIFSQFVRMLDLIKKELIARNIGYEYLTGSTTNREAVVNKFQQDPQIRVFLISLKAGGTGLNLTAADYIYLVDPWWNPAVENQAIDRSHRIGQNNGVVAVRLVCPDTVEEKILKLQEGKRQLSDTLVQTDAGLLKALNKSELLSLLS
ncbi:ATP-dependent helicase [Segetibacter sp. 3557_3]|uniref:DEAD/DEAH box helicase n=1 Tax=Segetibacter sp. 3557_3 TaxID=2547429 RepID=UPI0010591EE2|nr:DEAD/DEAH box helicase [Segetibacter sp. 3557_3]TDH21420.1 ATP-dependent helicase [Segetibacter sp. 3557_3]